MHYTDDPRLQLIFEILGEKEKASRAFIQYANKSRVYGDEELYMREAHFITAVGPGNGLIMSKIAEIMAVTHGAVSQIACRLEKKGYILRCRDPENHRQIIAKLTEKGEDFYRKHIRYDTAEYAEMDKRFFSSFTEEELRLIKAYEQAMYAIFTSKTESN